MLRPTPAQRKRVTDQFGCLLVRGRRLRSAPSQHNKRYPNNYPNKHAADDGYEGPHAIFVPCENVAGLVGWSLRFHSAGKYVPSRPKQRFAYTKFMCQWRSAAHSPRIGCSGSRPSLRHFAEGRANSPQALSGRRFHPAGRRLEDYGWGQITGAAVDVVHVPGDHDSIVRHPDVVHLANAVRQALNDCDRNFARSVSPAPA